MLPRSGQARRRLAALAALAAAGIATVGVFATSGGGGGGQPQRPLRPRRERTRRAAVAARPATPRGWRRRTGPVPVLMYHAIGVPSPQTTLRDLYLPAETFRAQMRWLAEHGYRGVTLEQVENAWYRRGLLPRRPVVVSFDDGYRGVYESAFPVLRALHWPALLDLTAGNTRSASGLPRPLVARMLRARWELASHTISHPDLRQLGPAELRKEVAGSRALLRRWFHVPVDNFAYPSGEYDVQVLAEVKRAGYRGAVTVLPGVARRSQRFQLRRIRVRPEMGVAGLASELVALGAGPS